MELTISLDDELYERAQELARRRGVDLERLLIDRLRALVETDQQGRQEQRKRSGAEAAAELIELMRTHGGHSGGRPWRREDAYEDRLGEDC
jgi:predicted transcriptional regulator